MALSFSTCLMNIYCQCARTWHEKSDNIFLTELPNCEGLSAGKAWEYDHKTPFVF